MTLWQTDILQEWGLNFPKDKQEANREMTKLKKFATVEDVAEQVYTLARMRTVTGVNSIIDAGLVL